MLATRGSDWQSDFLPSIRSADRKPETYVVRYAWSVEGAFFRVLRMTGIEYHNFTFEQLPVDKTIKKPIVRSWFPGYVFVSLDIDEDFWQQIYQMPGFLEILGRPSPLPSDEIERLGGLLSGRIAKVNPGRKFNPGDDVKICRGPFTSFPGIIKSLSTNGKMATIVAMIFGRPTNVDISIADIEKI
jgi:transcriptional antiterminator NusG